MRRSRGKVAISAHMCPFEGGNVTIDRVYIFESAPKAAQGQSHAAMGEELRRQRLVMARDRPRQLLAMAAVALR